MHDPSSFNILYSIFIIHYFVNTDNNEYQMSDDEYRNDLTSLQVLNYQTGAPSAMAMGASPRDSL